MMLRTLYRFYAKVASFQVFFCWYSKCHPEANLNINKRIVYFCVESGEVIALLSPKRPRVMRARLIQKVARVVQTDPTLLRYPSAITEQKKCWEFLAEKFDWCQTLRNNTQQHATGCANGRNM